MTDESPKWNCQYFNDYLGGCGHPESHLMACREKVCPLIKGGK